MAMPKGKFIDVDGVRTHYYEKGKGRPLVLVHGGNFGSKESSGNSWTWSRNFDALARRYHVMAVDKLGQGFTGNPRRDADYTMHAVVQHLGAFIRRKKLDNVNLVGHSRGGYVTCRLTLEQPELVRSCTIVDSNSCAPGVGMNEVVLANPPQPSLGRECQRWVLERYSYGPDHITEDWLDVLVRIGKTRKHLAAVRKMEAQGLKTRQFLPGLAKDRTDTYSRIRDTGMRRPTMIVWGYNDPTALLEQGWRLYDLISATEPRSYMHVINRSGHFSMRENPGHFTRLLDGFVQSC
jgi:pimeloyl-ACP methyl ester carboxylesterase